MGELAIDVLCQLLIGWIMHIITLGLAFRILGGEKASKVVKEEKYLYLCLILSGADYMHNVYNIGVGNRIVTNLMIIAVYFSMLRMKGMKNDSDSGI